MSIRPEPDAPASDEKLDSCPFCGMTDRNINVDARYEEERAFPCWTYVVICGGCAAQGPWQKSRSGCVRDWNRRNNEVEKGRRL